MVVSGLLGFDWRIISCICVFICAVLLLPTRDAMSCWRKALHVKYRAKIFSSVRFLVDF